MDKKEIGSYLALAGATLGGLDTVAVGTALAQGGLDLPNDVVAAGLGAAAVLLVLGGVALQVV